MNSDDLEPMVEALERSGRYRVLRKLETLTVEPSSPKAEDKVAAFVDVETTGLDTTKDEVIELGIVKFSYSLDGQVTGIIDTFDQLRQPSFPIPKIVTTITGITNEMVAGRQINEAAVNQLVDDADLVIAHNAAFDRRFLERLIPVFITKSWACSMTEVAWASNGYEGTKLAYLATEAGFFYERHRAENDCLAAIEILRRPLKKTGKSALNEMLNTARQVSWRLWALGASFDTKDQLKNRGYRWSNGEDGRPRSWFIEVADPRRESEMNWLASLLAKETTELKVERVTALDRFSDRSV